MIIKSQKQSTERNESDNDDDTFTLLKIPHGIPQKKTNRRKSATNARKSEDSTLIGSTSMRNVNGSTKKISRKSLLNLKADLDVKFKKYNKSRTGSRSNKENMSVNIYSDNMSDDSDESDDNDSEVTHVTNGKDADADLDKENQSTSIDQGRNAEVSFDTNEEYPHTPVENKIHTPTVSPSLPLKRRSLIGEVSQRKYQKTNMESQKRRDEQLSVINIDDDDSNGGADNIDQIHVQDVEETADGFDGDDDVEDDMILESEKLGKIHHKDITNEQSFNESSRITSHSINHSTTSELIEQDSRMRDDDTIRELDGDLDNDEIPSEDQKWNRKGSRSRRKGRRVTSRFVNTPDVSNSNFLSDSSPSTKEGYEVDRNQNVSTPTRMTEAVAVSPKTEQGLKTVDRLERKQSGGLNVPQESPLHAKSPKVSSSGPISNKKIPNRRNSILEMLDKEGDELLSELTKLVGETLAEKKREDPDASLDDADKPSFTIKQFANMQAQYDDNLNLLKDELEHKNKEILRLSEKLSSSSLEITELKSEIDNYKLFEKQLQEKNEMLTKHFEVLDKSLQSIRNENSSKDEKLNSYMKLSSRFKELYKEKQKEILILREENGKLSSGIEIMKQEKLDFINKAEYLEQKLTSISEDFKTLQDTHSKANEDLQRLKEKNEELDEENYGLHHQIQSLTKLKDEMANELSRLDKQLKSELEAKELLDREVKSVKETTEELDQKILELREALESSQEANSLKRAEIESLQAENKSLEDLLKEKDIKLEKYEDSLTEANAKWVDAMNETKAKLQEIKTLNEKLHALQESNKAVTEKKAEIERAMSELNDGFVSLKTSNENIKQELESVKNKHKTVKDLIESKDSEISDLHEKLNKMEESHIEELEKIQHEITFLQNSISSKNRDLTHFQESNDSLAEENKKFAIKVSDFEKQIAQYQKQIETLKNQQYESDKKTEERLTKLSEDLYVQYSKKHEQKIAILKKGYETKWQSKLNNANATANSLKREVQGLKDQLKNVQREKDEMAKLWDKIVTMENAGKKLQK